MSLLALALLPVLALPAQRGGVDPVDAEFAVRELAMGALLETPAGEDWPQHYRLLEGLGRRVPGDLAATERAWILSSVTDEHPNVRAAALAACAEHGLSVPEVADSLVADAMPEVRLQLARALASPGQASSSPWLLKLAFDPDEGVARIARTQFLSAPATSTISKVQFVQEHWDRFSALEYLDLLDGIERSNGCDALTRLIARWLAESSASPSGPKGQIQRALWFTLPQAPVDGGALPWIAQQWLTPFPSTGDPRLDSRIEIRRRRRLDGLVLPEPQRSELVQALLALAVEEDRVANEEGPDSSAARSRSDRAVAGAVSVHFAWSPSGPIPPFPIAADWSEALEEEVWRVCFGWGESWGEGAQSVLDSESKDVRLAAWNTLAETWNRTGTAPPRRWLSRALEDPYLAESVYRELVHSRRPLKDLDLLHAWWSRRPLALQLDLLREHWTGRRYELWRRELLDFWAMQTGEQRTVLQLMAGFEGDEPLADRFLAGLEEELDRLERSPVPDKEVIRGDWRESEARARWQLEAWMKIRGPGHVVERARLLLRVAKLGKELAKTLIANLVSTTEGCEALEEAFSRPELSRRARYEILLLHPGLGDARRLDELFLAYPTCDQDLQLRILERAGKGQNSLGRALLLEVAADGEEGPAHRFQAVASLVESGVGEPQVVGDLLRMLDGTEDFEFQQVLIRALGSLALDHGPLNLLERYDDEFERSMIGDELLAAMVRIELRAARGNDAKAQLSGEVLERWRGLAHRNARGELQARFDGQGLAARNFVYSGWLEAAASMSRAGGLEEALGERWWTWDGRLLMRLAEIAGDDTDPTRRDFVQRLEQAALVAMHGEGSASDRPGILMRLRGRLLAGDLEAGRWSTALARVSSILTDWRAARVPGSAIERTFGPTDPGLGVDPRTALLAIELECRMRLALAEGDRARVEELRPRLKVLAAGPSRMARGRLASLARELED